MKWLPRHPMGLLTWVLALVAVPVALYFAHVVDQRAEVRENDLRTLAKAADATERIFETMLGNVARLADCGFLEEFVRRQPRLTLADEGLCAGSKIKLDAARGSASLVVDGNAIGIELKALRSGQRSDTPNAEDKPIKLTVRMSDILAEIPFSDALDLLFVADHTGQVIEQHQPNGRENTGLQLTSLNGLELAEGDVVALDDLLRSSTAHTIELANGRSDLLCQPMSVGGQSGAAKLLLLCGLVATQGSVSRSLQVAPYLALTLLVVIVFAFLSWPLLKLKLMSERDRLRFSDVGLQIFCTCAGLMLGVILILGVAAQYRLVGESNAALGALAQRLQSHLEAELDGLTLAIRALDGDLAATLAAHADAADPAVTGALEHLPDVARVYSKEPLWEGTALAIPPGREVRWKPRDETRRLLQKHDFDIAFWTRCGGTQALKATVQERVTTRIDLSERAYFQRVTKRELWPGGTRAIPRYVESVRSLITGEFTTIVAIESYVSAREAAPPAPDETTASAAAGTGSDRVCPLVAAIQANLISTSTPVLSPGVGFAVIDEKGTAVLHSDSRRALFENMFEELADGGRLRAIVRSRNTESMRTTYVGRPHQVVVRPMTTVPWSVVTFADMEVLDTNGLEIIGHAFIWTFVYLTLFMTLAGAYLALRGQEVPRCFWPRRNCGRVDVVLMASLLALPLFELAIIAWAWNRGALLLAAFVVPLGVVAAILYFYCWRMSPADPPAGSGLEQVRRHVWASFAFWIAVAIVPATIFFKVAVDGQNRALVRYENEHLAEGVGARVCAIEKRYAAIPLDAICEEETQCRAPPGRIEGLGSGGRDLYPSPLLAPASTAQLLAKTAPPTEWINANAGVQQCGGNATADTVCETERRIWIMNGAAPIRAEHASAALDSWSWFEWLKPIYNDTVVGTRYAGRGSSSTHERTAERYWHTSGDGSLLGADVSCGARVAVLSKAPLALESALLDWRTAVLGGGLLLALFAWARYGAKRMFFGDLDDRIAEDYPRFLERLRAESGSNQKLYAIVSSPAERARLLASRDEIGTFTAIDADGLTGAGTAKRATLAAVEAAAANDGNVLLVARHAPPHLQPLSDVRPATPEPGASAAPAPEWPKALDGFRVVNVAPTPPSERRSWAGYWRRQLDRPASDDWIDGELGAFPDLRALEAQLRPQLRGVTRRQALARISRDASACYTALWEACSQAEKVVLVQLALESVVNPKQAAVVGELLERGIVVRDPALRLFNQSFALFVTRAHNPVEMDKWVHHTSGMSWDQTRWVLLAFLTLGLLFLYVTHRELFDTSMMFLSAGAVGLPAILKALSSLSKAAKPE